MPSNSNQNFTDRIRSSFVAAKQSIGAFSGKVWRNIKYAAREVAKFFVELYQQLKGWVISAALLIHTYRLEILRSVVVVAFVYLLALNPFIALTVGIIGLFYFMNKRITADLKALEQNEQHKELKAEVTEVCTPLEKLAHACYDLNNPSNRIASSFSQDLVSGNFSDIHSLNDSNGIHVFQATPKSKSDPLVLACRGTQFGEFDDSVVIDFDPDSPGKTAFNALMKDNSPLAKINIEDSVTKISLCGHSLGGAISMRMAVEIMEAIDKGDEKFKNIEELEIAIFNSCGVDEALVDRANQLVDSLNGKLNIKLYAHFADLDPVTGSGLQLFANKKADNLSVYMVRKHLSLRMFAKVFPFNPALMHSMPFYGHHNYQTDDETLSLNRKIMKNRQHFYCNNTDGDAHEIERIFSATYSKFICNRVIYSLLKWIGPKNLTAIRELVILVTAVSVFIYYTVAVITAPTFFAYFAAWSALLYIFSAVEVSKTLDDTWAMVVRFFSWPARKIRSIRTPVKAKEVDPNADVACGASEGNGDCPSVLSLAT